MDVRSIGYDGWMEPPSRSGMSLNSRCWMGRGRGGDSCFPDHLAGYHVIRDAGIDRPSLV